jgi:hypothetical protein
MIFMRVYDVLRIYKKSKEFKISRGKMVILKKPKFFTIIFYNTSQIFSHKVSNVEAMILINSFQAFLNS